MRVLSLCQQAESDAVPTVEAIQDVVEEVLAYLRAHPGVHQGMTLMVRQLQPTAEGVPLAGWWQRAWATIIDSLILGLATVGAALPFIDARATGMQAWVEDVVRAAQSGGIPPEYTDPQYGLAGPIMTIYLVSLIVSIIYSTGMLMWKGGTLGQMALGLRVVPVNTGAQQHGLRLGMSLIRSIAFYGLSAITIIGLINVLVPLGNRKRQALHDMIAKTQVVKIR